jgi:serine/threonine protein kinase
LLSLFVVTASSTLGSYRLIAELGHGGMADVFLAAAEGPIGSGFTKLAVIKKLRSHLAEDPEFISMLMDEARVTARLSHPNVVQLFEVGRTTEEYFLAIEFLEGQPLHRVARRFERTEIGSGPLRNEIYYPIISDVLAGLHHAHQLTDYDESALGIVHRDVTPHNVFVTYDGVVKVVDFGIAKAIGRLTETQHGVVKGKIRYMSPEQAVGGEVDRRTDIFAVGVMLWNLATGTKLWGEASDLAVAHSLYTGDYPASPRQLCPDVPEEIDAICQRALAFRREDRYETAVDMRAELEAFLGDRGSDLRRKLGGAMKQAFEPERAKLRKVLENASLATVPSAGVWNAAGGFGAPERTELMELAPPRPVSFGSLGVDDLSLSPFEIAATEQRMVDPARVALASSSSIAARKEPPPPRRYFGVAIAAALGLVIGSAALMARPVLGIRAAAAARSPAVLAAEPTPLSDQPRAKAPIAAPADKAEKTDKPAPAAFVPIVARGSRRTAVVAVAPAAAPANAAVGGGAAAKISAAPKEPPLDNSDPWGADKH